MGSNNYTVILTTCWSTLCLCAWCLPLSLARLLSGLQESLELPVLTTLTATNNYHAQQYSVITPDELVTTHTIVDQTCCRLLQSEDCYQHCLLHPHLIITHPLLLTISLTTLFSFSLPTNPLLGRSHLPDLPLLTFFPVYSVTQSTLLLLHLVTGAWYSLETVNHCH